MALPLSLRTYALSEDSLSTFIQSSFDEFHRRKASYRMQSEPPPTITPWYLVLLPKLKADAQLIQTPLPVPKEYKTTFYLYKIFVAISVNLRTNIITSKTKRMGKIYKNALHNVFNSIQSRKKEQITRFPPPISPTSMTFCVGNYNEKCNFFFFFFEKHTEKCNYNMRSSKKRQQYWQEHEPKLEGAHCPIYEFVVLNHITNQKRKYNTTYSEVLDGTLAPETSLISQSPLWSSWPESLQPVLTSNNRNL